MKDRDRQIYPRWLLLFFAITVTSLCLSWLAMMIKLIIAISIWQLPSMTDGVGLWVGLSCFGLWLSVVIASKYDRR